MSRLAPRSVPSRMALVIFAFSLPLADLIDGAIVGSYFIRLLEEQGFAPEAAETYCRTFKKELNA